MKTIRTSLVHRVVMPEDGAAAIHPTLLLLHGRGADEEDLIGLTEFLDSRLLVVSVRAPFPFEYGGFTWYDAGSVGTPDPGRFTESFDRLATFLGDIVRGYPVDASRLFLLGFSMGTVMALSVALTMPELFRGVSANSGYLVEEPPRPYSWREAERLNVFLTHGTADPIIPLQMARRARQILMEAGVTLLYREYPAGHEISQQTIVDVADWMEKLM